MSTPISSEEKEPSMNDVKAVLQNALIAIRTLRIVAATVIQRHARGDTAEPGITMLHDGLELTKAYRNVKLTDLLKASSVSDAVKSANASFISESC